MATATRLTPDDLLAMPGEGRGFELIDGELREKVMSVESGHIGDEIRRLIANYAYPLQLGVMISEQAGFRCFEDPDRLKRPDVSFIMVSRWSPAHYHARGYCMVRPDFVAEVVSPNESNDTIHDKREEWLSAGVRIFWMVDPRDETIRVYTPGQRPQLFTSLDTIALGPILPGFQCQVSEIFKPPPGSI